jgi:hypothetical protein
LQPHRAETFKLSSDPWFVEQVRDFALLTERALKRGVYRSVRALEQTIEG